MPYDGNGVYSLPSNTFAQPATGTAISSTDATALWADITTALSTCVVDSQTPSPTLISPIVNEILDTNSNELLEFGVTAFAVNNLKIFNRDSGNAPYIKVQGEANIGTTIVDSNNVDVLDFEPTASAVNWLSVTNAATGNGPLLSAVSDGTDANVDIGLVPLGTGGVYGTLTTHSSSPVATTSGQIIEFASIPTWVKRITISFAGVSTVSASALLSMTISDVSAGYASSGYEGMMTELPNAGSIAQSLTTNSFSITNGLTVGTDTLNGDIVLNLVDDSAWIWSIRGSLSETSATGKTWLINGSVTLTDDLDGVKITSAAVYDAGKVSCEYEG